MNYKLLCAILFAYACLTTGHVFSQHVVVDDDFNNITFPFEGWTEINTDGQVTIVDGELRFDYTTDRPGAIRAFDEANGIVTINMQLRSTRNWIYYQVYFRDAEQDTIAALGVGQTSNRGIFAITELDENGLMAEGVNGISGDFNSNTDYNILFAINLFDSTSSLFVNGEQQEAAADIPLLSDADNINSAVFLNYYMYSNEGRVFLDDLLITYYQADKTELSILLQYASGLLQDAVAGTQPGQYPQEAIDAFSDEISLVQAVYDDLDASQEEVDEASLNLAQAIETFVASVIPSVASVSINTEAGHPLGDGFSGYNVRTSDGPWNYNHPEFREAVEFLRPGFLRYFSGTTGSYFNMSTAMMELEWFEQYANYGQVSGGIPNLYKWVEVKGPHRLVDLYDMLGENNARLVITYNSFTDSPENAARLARFCKNNNIIVDYWQFTNEPNFYTPPRRYFFNDGFDYAEKQQEAAEAILAVDPSANLALSYGWDGLAGFANGISNYSPVYWQTVSFHAYPVHADDTDFETAMRRANSRLVDRTNNAFYNKVQSVSWPNAEFIITEYSTWNDMLNRNLYGSLFLAEYALRMSAQPNAKLVGHHAVNLAARPENMHTSLYLDAYEAGLSIDPDTVPTGIDYTSNALAYHIINKALNNSDKVYQTFVSGGVSVPGQGSQTIAALYARAYSGTDGKDYLLVTNKSPIHHELTINFNGSELSEPLHMTYMSDNNPQASSLHIEETVVESAVTIPPFAIVRLEWPSQHHHAPTAPRIYGVVYGDHAVTLSWWQSKTAESYRLSYGTAPGSWNQEIQLDAETNSFTVDGLAGDQKYYFVVSAVNDAGESEVSNEVAYLVSEPEAPVLDASQALSGRVKIEWESVPFANGYRVRYGTSPGSYDHEVDAGNVTGYVFRNLANYTPYYFTVVAYNGVGESLSSNELSQMSMSNIPFAPRYLHGFENEANGVVHLEWIMSDSTHNATTNLYRSTMPWAEYELVKAGIEGTSWADSTKLEAGRYFYRVSAENAFGESYFKSNIFTMNKNVDTDDFFTHVADLADDKILMPGQLKIGGGRLFGPVNQADGLCFTLTVYDLSGRLVFRGGQNEYWNGRVGGGIARPGLYVWRMEVEQSGRIIYQNGKVILYD